MLRATEVVGVADGWRGGTDRKQLQMVQEGHPVS